MIRMEADRFQNLEYSEAAFRTEALAVLGEYNKSSASPSLKMDEVLSDLAFKKHTYRHTTMGYLDDIKNMPNEYAYSRQFFDRYYRPEYTVIIVSGDINAAQTKTLVDKYWGNWKRGTHKADIPQEPPQAESRSAHIDWPTPTLPWVIAAFKVPAYSDTAKDMAALDVLSFLGFSESSPLYRRLVLEEQKVDVLSGGYYNHLDPHLFTVNARVKKKEDMDSVREAVLSTMAGFKDTPVSPERLDQVKKHLRYQFALSMDNSEAIASTLAHYVALNPTPETLNRLYDMYSKVTAEDIREVARKYFVENGRSLVTLTGVAK